MKFHFPLTICILLFYCFSSEAQLGGSYTIDASKSASATNYKDFGSAISDMISGFRADGGTVNGKGVSNSVLFKVADGSYNEQLLITSITGASASNTITFASASGDSTKVDLYWASSASSTNNYVLRMTGAKYVTFKNMTFQRTGSAYYSTVIEMYGGSNYNTFRNNCILGLKSSTALYKEETLILSAMDNDTGNTFSNNYLRYGSLAIYLVGASNEPSTRIMGNLIDSPYFTGMYLTSQSNPEISGNTIHMGTNVDVNAIYLYLCTSAKVLKNKIHLSDGHYGIYSNTSGGTSSDYQLVANNFIMTSGTSSTTISYGIYSNKGSYQNYFNNNVLNTCAGTGVADILIDNGSYINIMNNNLINTGVGYAIDLTSNATVDSLDYNNYYISGSNVAQFKGIQYATLTDFITATGKDNHSVQIDPKYISDFDLHVKNNKLIGTGLPLAQIVDDIDGQIRNSIAPTIGADEILLNDAGLLSHSDQVFCEGGKTKIIVGIQNHGSDTLKTLDINWSLNAVSKGKYSWSGALKNGAADSNVAIDSFQFKPGKNQMIKVWISNPNGKTDDIASNDTINYLVTVNPMPNPKWTYSQSKNVVSFAATDTTLNSYTWDFGDQNNSSVANPSHTYSASKTYNVSLMVEDKNGCKAKYDSSVIFTSGIDENILNQNSVSIYPNPFAGNTTYLEYTLSKSAIVKIALYTFDGREISIIADKWQSAGRHKYPVFLNGMNQGIYFLEITINESEVILKKILQVK